MALTDKFNEEWNGFKGRLWKEEVNTRQFIQDNYKPYDGDESFLAGPTEATNKLWGKLQKLQKEKSRYNQMRKKLDFSWTPTLKLVINGKFVDQYTFLDEDYYSLPSKKQKEKKQDYIDKLSSWLDQIYQD